MKLNVLLLGAAVAALSFAAFAGTSAYSLKAAASQPSPADTTVTTVAYVNPATPISPRAQANQSKILQGVSSNQDSTLGCRKNMIASPKAVAECASHATMPGCVTVVLLK